MCLGCVKCDLWLGRWLICGGGRWLWLCSVCLSFFLVAVADIGGGGRSMGVVGGCGYVVFV